jgi:hypothetical protein
VQYLVVEREKKEAEEARNEAREGRPKRPRLSAVKPRSKTKLSASLTVIKNKSSKPYFSSSSHLVSSLRHHSSTAVV